MRGRKDNLKFHDDQSEQQSGDIVCSAMDASLLISVANVIVGYGIGPNHEFTIHSAEELRQACIDGLIAEKLAHPTKRLPLLLCVRIGGRNFGPTSPEMWPWDSHGCFLVPSHIKGADGAEQFKAFWAAIGQLINHVSNLNAMCMRIAEGVA